VTDYFEYEAFWGHIRSMFWQSFERASGASQRENGAAFDTIMTSFDCDAGRIVTFSVGNVSSTGNNTGAAMPWRHRAASKKMANSGELAILLSTAQ
jgi:hypothetical protein